MSAEPDWMLLTRSLLGSCTPEEAAALARWEAADEENARLLGLMRRVWDDAAVDRRPIDEAEAWEVVRARLNAAARPAVVRPLRVVVGGAERRPGWVRRVLVGAAAAAIVAAAGLLAWRGAEAPVPAGPGRVYTTLRGQLAQLTLVDGTRVWLSVDSRLEVPADYGERTRDVTLQGEAYFVVQANPKLPFRVHTRGAVSEDLGTEFNVRAYPGEGTQVLVAVGRVAFRPAASTADSVPGVELVRGQMGRIDRHGRVTVDERVDLAQALAWRRGQLTVVDRPLAEVLPQVERWYDLDIALDDSSLAGVRITASLGGRTPDQVLAIIAGVLDAGYVRHGRVARLTAKKPPH